MGPFERQVESSLTEKLLRFPLNDDFVDKLENDYRMLTRNFPRVNEKNADMFLAGLKRFAHYIESTLTDAGGENGKAISRMFDELISRNPQSSGWLEGHKKEIRSAAWDFLLSLDISGKRNWFAASEIKTHRSRMNRLAKKLFDSLREFTAWSKTRLNDSPQVRVATDETMEISGYQTILSGFDEADDDHVRALRLTQKALEIARRQTTKNAPWLKKRELPVFVVFNCNDMNAGGRFYYKDRKPVSMICPANYFGDQPEELAKTVIHEFGHGVYDHLVHPNLKRYWEKSIYFPRQKLNFKRVLELWPVDKKYLGSARDVIAGKDIEVAVALDILSAYDRQGVEVNTRESVARLAANGVEVEIPKHPITAYATKNPDESFCEALSHWIVYGPGRLHPAVVYTLKHVLGLE